VSQNLGRLLENVVFSELIRRGFNTNQSLFYYRTHNDREIDFVCREGHRVTELIQVAYNINSEKTLKRELTALYEASNELTCENLSLITWEDEKNITDKNKTVKIIPAWKWLTIDDFRLTIVD
jgi:predicted AAA+ superfamily ATPase